ERGMSMLVVHAALAAIRQHLVGLLGLLESGLGLRVPGVAVGVVLHRTAAIGLLQFLLGGAAGDAQDFVVVALAHQSGPCCLADQTGMVHMRDGNRKAGPRGSRRRCGRAVSPSFL